MIRGRRPLACHHEAGHAVARWWLGFHSDDVVVLTIDEAQAGVVVVDRKGNSHRCEGHAGGYDIHMPMMRERLTVMPADDPYRDDFTARAARRTEMALVELYAGAYAEARYTRRPALACFLAGGDGDLDAARRIAAEWFETEDDAKAARHRADDIARALMRSPKGWAATRAVAAALLDRGRITGRDVEALCDAAYGGSLEYDRWDTAWPPTPAQIRSGFLPVREARRAA